MKYVKDKVLLNNIFISSETEKSEWKDGESEFIRRQETDTTNLFQPRLIKIFAHAEKIMMAMNEDDKHENIYTLSLIALLSLIDGTTIKNIGIQYYWGEDEGTSWIKRLWELYGEPIRNRYEEKGYTIKYKSDEAVGTNCIFINKL